MSFEISTSTTPTSIAISRRIAEVSRFRCFEVGLYVWSCLGMAYDTTHEHDLIRGTRLSAPLHEVYLPCTILHDSLKSNRMWGLLGLGEYGTLRFQGRSGSAGGRLL